MDCALFDLRHMPQNLKASQHKGKVGICLVVIFMPQKDIGVIIHIILCMSVAATVCEQISVIAQNLSRSYHM